MNRYPLYRRLGGPQGWSGEVRKISPHQDSIPGPSSPQAVAIPTTLPGLATTVTNAKNLKAAVFTEICDAIQGRNSRAAAQGANLKRRSDVTGIIRNMVLVNSEN